MFILSTLPIGLRNYPEVCTIKTKETKDKNKVVCDYHTKFSSGGQQLPLASRIVFDKESGKPISGYIVSPTVKGKIKPLETDNIYIYGFPSEITLSGHKEPCQEYGFPQQIKVKANLDFDTGSLYNIQRFNLEEPSMWEGAGKWVTAESEQNDPRNQYEIPLLVAHCKAYVEAATDIIARRVGTQQADAIINPPN